MTTRLILIATMAAFLAAGCSEHTNRPPPHGEVGVAVAPTSIPGNSVSKAGPVTPVSGGPNLTGVTAVTAEGAVKRIQNGLEGSARATVGNFARALAQVQSNLPNSANVQNAAGFDQVQLLAYAACSDLTTGSTPLMRSRYNVDPAASITANQTALIAAGVRMLDQHTAGLASKGPDAAAVATVFTNLVQAEAANAANTSRIAFMSVCMAANTAGAAMLGL